MSAGVSAQAVAMWLARKRSRSSGWERTCRALRRRRTPNGDEEPKVTTADFLNGTVAESCAARYCYLAVQSHGRPTANDIEIKVASLCSGSEMVAVVASAIGKALAVQGVPVRFQFMLLCEVVAAKREWGSNVVDCLFPDNDACHFDNVTTLGAGRGYCTKHLDNCCIPECDLLVSGFSCKDFSSQASHVPLSQSAFAQGGSTTGGSSQTFWGTLGVIDEANPDIVFLENVEQLENTPNQAIVDVIHVELAKRSFDVQAWIADTMEYALPHHRRRLFMMCVRRPGRVFQIANHDAFFKSVFNLLDMFKAEPCDLTECLLDSSHEVVQREFSVREARGKGKQFDQNTIKLHRAEFQKAGVRWGSISALKEDLASPWFPLLPQSMQATLAFHHRSAKSSRELPQYLQGVDLSQSINRRIHTTTTRTGKLVTPTILPRSCLWMSIEQGKSVHRPLLGIESMMLQGFPIMAQDFRNIFEKLGRGDAFLQDLAGNAFSSSVVCALITATLFSAELTPGTSSRVTLQGAAAEEALALFTNSAAVP